MKTKMKTKMKPVKEMSLKDRMAMVRAVNRFFMKKYKLKKATPKC